MWLTLKKSVLAGRTVTYGELAEMSGRRRGAARAAGTAMRSNPAPLIVPCHRVVKGGGVLGRYSGSGGTLTKQWLIRHEEAAIAAAELEAVAAQQPVVSPHWAELELERRARVARQVEFVAKGGA